MVAIQKRAFGHAKAGALIARVFSSQRIHGLDFLFHLSKLGFYGEDIWWGYTNFCRSDFEYFIACVEIEDKNFYNAVMDWKAQEALKALNGEK